MYHDDLITIFNNDLCILLHKVFQLGFFLIDNTLKVLLLYYISLLVNTYLVCSSGSILLFPKELESEATFLISLARDGSEKYADFSPHSGVMKVMDQNQVQTTALTTLCGSGLGYFCLVCALELTYTSHFYLFYAKLLDENWESYQVCTWKFTKC